MNQKMRKLYISFTVAAAIVLASCNDYLDKTPDNRAQLNSSKAIRQLLVSAYPDQSYQVFTESMSDNVTDRGAQANDLATNSPTNLLSQQAYFWENMKGDDQDSPTAYWTGCYSAIAACNHALEAIEKLHGRDEDFMAAKGEALICRAYAHFMLVNIFAEHYDPTTASTALGIPYVTFPEKVVFQTYTRNTVKEVYDKIIADFNAGFPLINDAKYGTPQSWHFTKSAAASFASRLYLYINEPDSVIKYSSLVLDKNPANSLRDWNGAYALLSSSPSISTQYDRSEESCNTLIAGCVSWLSRAIYNRYGMDFNLMNTVGRKKNVTGGTNAFSFYGSSTSNFVFVPKYEEYFKRESINANYGLGYVMIPLFTTDEVILNRAEAYAMKSDFANSLVDINAYYSKRIPKYNAAIHSVTSLKITTYTASDATAPAPFYSINSAQLSYIKVLLDMRRSEFLHEGLRWFDIKRMHLTVKHNSYLNSATTLTLEPNDLRRVVQIPTDALTFGLIPNERINVPSTTITRLD